MSWLENDKELETANNAATYSFAAKFTIIIALLIIVNLACAYAYLYYQSDIVDFLAKKMGHGQRWDGISTCLYYAGIAILIFVGIVIYLLVLSCFYSWGEKIQLCLGLLTISAISGFLVSKYIESTFTIIAVSLFLTLVVYVLLLLEKALVKYLHS